MLEGGAKALNTISLAGRERYPERAARASLLCVRAAARPALPEWRVFQPAEAAQEQRGVTIPGARVL